MLGFAERNPGLTSILTGHALMFEQDRLQGRINHLFERIESQLKQVLREHKLREGKALTHEESLPASCSPSAKGCCHAMFAQNFAFGLHRILRHVGHCLPPNSINIAPFLPKSLCTKACSHSNRLARNLSGNISTDAQVTTQ